MKNQARGLIAQITDEPEIKEPINNGGARFYIGFAPLVRLEAARAMIAYVQQSAA